MTQRADFDKIELSLVRVLHTLITERSVSRAALRLQSSQPAVSAQLRRLRELTGDPLLVRAGNGMTPTAVAMQLAQPAASLLLEAERLFSPKMRERAFDPVTSESTFRIAASDYLDPLFLPELVAHLKHAAPSARIELMPLSGDFDYRSGLASGDVDLVIGNWLEPPEELHLGRLMSDEIVCMVHEDHPAVRLSGGRGWTVQKYLECEHVAPTPTFRGARGVIDDHLEGLGVQRDIMVRSSHFSLIPLMVAQSLLVLTTGRLYCTRYVDSLPVRIVRCPVAFPPLTYFQLWHDLTHASAPMRWLREQVRDVARGLASHAMPERPKGRASMSSPGDRTPQGEPLQRIALRGDLLDFITAPAWGVADSPAVRFREDHWLLIENGRIAGARPGSDEPDATWTRRDHRGRLILPGFIDTHVHSPQLDVIASHGTALLDWLDTYTFPAERRYADALEARTGAARFLDALLAHGTTSAVVFPTVHKVSADTLFAAALERGMRLVAGKVLMDRNAPEGLLDESADHGARDCVDLIDRWHGRGRLAYAVTVRFAPTSTPEQLAMAGQLCTAYPGVYMQTHVAENQDEVRWVRELFPDARSYLDVYDQAGLLNARGVFAHGIWLDDEDRAALREAGAQIAHSPSSNLFLGSGLFDWRACEDAGVRVSMATDVGGGTSLSMQRTLSDAYKIQALRGERLTAWKALHTATLGAAVALGLQEEIGSFAPGCAADVCIWDWAVGPVSQRRQEVARNLHERVFAWMTLSDDRNLVATLVEGTVRYERG